MRHLLLALITPWLLQAAAARPAPSPANAVPREVEAVRRHILEDDYPELFGDASYRTRIEDAVVADLDGDGKKEVVVLFAPHYRQSAPILIYRLARDPKVTRVAEGLAPGPLVPLSGDYLDSHTLGEAVDMTVGKGPDPDAFEKLLGQLLTKQRGGLVVYKSFLHVDSRKGASSYIDMRQVDVPKDAETCGDFEFSHVEELAAGALDGKPGSTWLAARVGAEVWMYHIAEFLSDGRLRKEVRIARLPADFAAFAPSSPPTLSYETKSGKTLPFPGDPR